MVREVQDMFKTYQKNCLFFLQSSPNNIWIKKGQWVKQVKKS